MQRVKRQATEWDGTFTIYITIKVLVYILEYLLRKKVLQSNEKKADNPIGKKTQNNHVI